MFHRFLTEKHPGLWVWDTDLGQKMLTVSICAPEFFPLESTLFWSGGYALSRPTEEGLVLSLSMDGQPGSFSGSSKEDVAQQIEQHLHKHYPNLDWTIKSSWDRILDEVL